MATHDVDDDAYESIVKSMEKDLARSSRERQIERVIGEPMPRILRRFLDRHNGSKRPALREINSRLEEAEDYDHETHGKVSPNTFYGWLDTYGEALSDVA